MNSAVYLQNVSGKPQQYSDSLFSLSVWLHQQVENNSVTKNDRSMGTHEER